MVDNSHNIYILFQLIIDPALIYRYKKEQIKAGMRVMSAIEMFVTSSSTLMLILVIYGLGQMAN